MFNRDVGIGCLEGINHCLRAGHIGVLGAGEKRDRSGAGTTFTAATAEAASATAGSEQRARRHEGRQALRRAGPFAESHRTSRSEK
jgi:hypothetical protein